MTFRRFIYYCAVCGGAAAFVGWMAGKLPPLEASVLLDALKALCLGTMLGAVLAAVDSLWNFSRARLPVAVLRVAVAGLAGGGGGLFGALIGSGLAWATNLDVFRIFGWTLTGLLIGASVGVFDLVFSLAKNQDASGPLKKIMNGLIGGGVGGLLGGGLYVLFMTALARLFAGNADLLDSLWSPSAIGFVVLGLCIGLLVGLAQVILREAWVKVEAGFRPGRELIVSKEIVIGRAESCDIGLFGDNAVERTHARILRKGDRYLLVDADTPAGTYLNGRRIDEPTPLRSGDEVRVGRNTLRFGERQKRSSEPEA